MTVLPVETPWHGVSTRKYFFMIFNPLSIKNRIIDPPLFCAPMAGITHSAFRRLLADFSGYGALFTEMLSGRAILHEEIGNTPFTKRRFVEGKVWYQLAVTSRDNIPEIVERLKIVEPFALDINAACPAPEMTCQGYGASLFRDLDGFAKTIAVVRQSWDGILTLKCRLGDEGAGWKEKFIERLRIMEKEGIDAVIVHPRFFKDKLKRRARWELFSWIATETSLPIIANGDIVSQKQLREETERLSNISGLMIGRMAVVKPWFFCELSEKPATIDHAATWSTFYNYVLEDFPRGKAIGRIKEFSKYFAQNFLFGHELYRNIQSASDLESVYGNAMRFLKANPKATMYPTVRGL
jgi:tRNA-dihydrouridine synthase B